MLLKSIASAACAFLLASSNFVNAAPVSGSESGLEKRLNTYVNDWTCKPSASKPYPLVLVHATFSTQSAK